MFWPGSSAPFPAVCVIQCKEKGRGGEGPVSRVTVPAAWPVGIRLGGWLARRGMVHDGGYFTV
jgi:hypothetical protein